MTDPGLADATYIEPITPDMVAKIIEKERPDAILPTMGGQTALNTAMALHRDGRLKKYKRVDIVIRAFAGLQLPEATLEIAGTGDYRARLELLVNSLKLAERVKFLGFITEDEKIHLLRRAWASTLASPKEGWGISNLEAAACATPVIAANSPGIRESVIDGETGFLVPPDDVPAMTAAMRGIVESPALVSSLGAAGRRYAEAFTWERSANDTLAHLEQVIAR